LRTSRVRELGEGRAPGDAFRGVNAQGLVPALEDGGQVLIQSLRSWSISKSAILCRRWPKTRERAYVRAVTQIIAARCTLNNLRTLKHLRKPQLDEEGVNSWYRHWIAKASGCWRYWKERSAMASTPWRRGLDADCCSCAGVQCAAFNCELAPYRRSCGSSTRACSSMRSLDAADA